MGIGDGVSKFGDGGACFCYRDSNESSDLGEGVDKWLMASLYGEKCSFKEVLEVVDI